MPHLGEPLAREQNAKDERDNYSYRHLRGNEEARLKKKSIKIADTLFFPTALPSSVGHYTLAQTIPFPGP